ncbi:MULTISPECIES: hypothetical protein [Sphingomonas]|uniref:hypothetical protein n=1 Tax=Sphingomonas TaxID=13687 RepID=UPI000F7D7F34|nr:hypothetical protein [Sphingomonas sp. ABOLF]RSV14634.1 hypothetical protein CA235_11180 [Sphingomonas sp. ABOLF]GLK19236.1 hypothetical protein GCM10017606_00620 [Microbacterium terregens]
MKPATVERLTELIGKGYDLTLDDMSEFDFLTTQMDWEDACRAIDAVKLIITDPIYEGDVPADYFEDGEEA